MRSVLVLVLLPLALLLRPPTQIDEDGVPPLPREALFASVEPIPEVSGMVYVPSGEFIMGSTYEDVRSSADVDEYPQRTVYVEGFYIDVAEVTNIQYKLFLDSTGGDSPKGWIETRYPKGRDGYPVVGVTWHDAAAYARFAAKRLPTEEEWEKAARGTDGRKYPWGESYDKKNANRGNRLMRVRRFPGGISPYGLFDMAGNAAEWVDGWYAQYPRDENDPVKIGRASGRESV